MKKIAFMTVPMILFLAVLPAHSQLLSYGAKLGMGFPGFVDEDIASQRITLALSLTGSLNLSDRIQIQTDPGFQRKGNKFTYQVWDDEGFIIDDSSYVVKTNLDYVTLPLFVKLNFGGANSFYLQAGAYYGYLLSARFTGKLNHEMVKRQPIREGLHPHDFGILAGGGIVTPVREGLSVLLDIKYQKGLKDLNLNGAITGHDQPLMNKGLAMSMGFLIEID